MVFMKKILLGVAFSASMTAAVDCVNYWTYMYHDSTLQYIYTVGNPDYTGSLPWWNCPAGLLFQGFPTTAAPFDIITDPKSGFSTISFITNLRDDQTIIPGGSAAEGTCRLAMAVQADGTTVGFQDISVPGSATTTPGCLWKIINDGPDANGVQHCRVIAASSVNTTPLYLTFEDGLCVKPVDPANQNSVQFSMAPTNAISVEYDGACGPSPLIAIDGFAGLSK